jgi:hypothetical protein
MGETLSRILPEGGVLVDQHQVVGADLGGVGVARQDRAGDAARREGRRHPGRHVVRSRCRRGGEEQRGPRPVKRSGIRGARQGTEAVADQRVVPAGAILVEQKDRFAVRPGARAEARGLQLHQRDEPVHLRLVGRQLGQHAA